MPVYINPLVPPKGAGHPCWTASACYFLELRADQPDTLLIPAGMLHFVLTLQGVLRCSCHGLSRPPLHPCGHCAIAPAGRCCLESWD